jgi:hypothetical protein
MDGMCFATMTQACMLSSLLQANLFASHLPLHRAQRQLQVTGDIHYSTSDAAATTTTTITAV